MTSLFDPAASRAVLFGCSRYPHDESLTPLPAVRANLVVLETLLIDTELCGLAREHCEVITDPASAREVGFALHQAGLEAQDLFLVYYAGHGLISRTGDLYLAITTTDTRTLNYTAIPFTEVRDSIRQSVAKNRVLILDCCFSGRAIEAQSDPLSLARGQLDIEGAYTLTATPRNAAALAPVGDALTAFTGELAEVLRSGIQGGEPVLSLDAVYTEVYGRLTRKGRPQPDVSSTRTSGRLGIVRNTFGVRTVGLRVDDTIVGRQLTGDALPSFAEGIEHTSALLEGIDASSPGGTAVPSPPETSIASLARDVQAVVDNLRRTIGPVGRSTLVRKLDGTYLETSDSRAIINAYREHSASRPGIGFVVDLAGEMLRCCGDGVATAAILGGELVRGLADALSAGHNPIGLGRDLQSVHEMSMVMLEPMVMPVRMPAQLASAIAAQGVAQELVEVLVPLLAGDDWFEILVEPGEGHGVETIRSPAIRIDTGFLSHYFITDPGAGLAELDAPHVLVLSHEAQLDSLLPLLEQIMPTTRPVAVFAPSVTGELLSTLVVNKVRGTLRSVAIGVAGAGQPEATLRAIAAATGATLITSPQAVKAASLANLGSARRLVAGSDQTTLLTGSPAVRQLDVSSRVEAGQAILLRVGAPTHSPQSVLIEEARNAIRVSRRLLDGVLPGGRCGYLRLADRLELDCPESVTRSVVTEALRAPAWTIASNAGQPGTRPEQLLKTAGPTEAYDVASGSLVDMWSHPLIDSALTVRRAWDVAHDMAKRYLELS